MPYICIRALDGTALMPTTRQKHVNHLLKAGKARIASQNPYTIQLLYKSRKVTQPLVMGIDPGRTNIGVSVINEKAEPVFTAVLETRNREIPKLMEDRRRHRQASRRGEREVRKRRAIKYGTVMKEGSMERKLPQYGSDSCITCKVIKNTEARFCNRRRKPGWLTPTAEHLVRTHVNLVHKVMEYVPVTDIAIEANRFAFMLMDDPETSGTDFQNGPLKGFEDIKEAVYAIQKGKCIMCDSPIDGIHHLVPRSRGGSNTIRNLAGMCSGCHERRHTEKDFADRMDKKHEGLLKKYGALSVLNQAFPHIWDRLRREYGNHVAVVSAKDTARTRVSLGYEKTKDNPMHGTDAYCIACFCNDSVPEKIPGFNSVFRMKQFRNHDRALVKSQRERTYRLDGAVVAKNRKPRFEQKVDALSDWYRKQEKSVGSKVAEHLRSRLTVQKSTRRYNDTKRILPGAVFLYRGNTYVLGGQQNNGYYYYPYQDDRKEKKILMRSSECRIMKTGGIVFMYGKKQLRD